MNAVRYLFYLFIFFNYLITKTLAHLSIHFCLSVSSFLASCVQDDFSVKRLKLDVISDFLTEIKVP